MDLDISKDSLAVFAALDSDVRIRIIQLLSKKTTKRFRDFKCPGAQQPITLMHLNKLEKAHIIRTVKKGKQRISVLKIDTINISFPQQLYTTYENWKVELPVGQYTNFHVAPTCGLAGPKGFIGKVDNPSYFMDNAFPGGHAVVC